MDKIQYFPHDVGARNDPKIVHLRCSLGRDAVSIYWDLVEMLYENPDNRLATNYKLLGKKLQYNSKK